MSEKNSTHDGSDEGVVGSKRYSKFLAEFQFLPVQGILNVLADQPWFDRRYAVKVIDNTPFLPGNAYVTTATAPTRPKPQAGVATHHQFNSKKEVRSVWTPVGVI